MDVTQPDEAEKLSQGSQPAQGSNPGQLFTRWDLRKIPQSLCEPSKKIEVVCISERFGEGQMGWQYMTQACRNLSDWRRSFPPLQCVGHGPQGDGPCSLTTTLCQGHCLLLSCSVGEQPTLGELKGLVQFRHESQQRSLFSVCTLQHKRCIIYGYVIFWL